MTFTHRHLLGIEHLRPEEIVTLLDLADDYVTLNQGATKHSEV
ncbi:MAG: aspartate carbamoyltransferase catalytic subunit, partial [Pseudomonadota bacterium]